MSFTLGVKDGDFEFNSYGRSVVIEGADKTSQDLAQIQLSRFNARRNYGCRAEPGAVPVVGGESWLSTELHMTVDRLQGLQQSLRATTPDEEIAGVDRLDVIQDQDKTSFNYALEVRTRSGSSFTTEGSVRRRRVSMSHIR